LELYFAYSVTQIYHSVHGGVITMWDISCFIATGGSLFKV
jgi:hypothetical protein